MRLYVRVPQNYAPYIRAGMTVDFTVPQYPGQLFHAELVANANAVASATGTLLVQFAADNATAPCSPAPMRKSSSRCRRGPTAFAFPPPR